MTGPDTPPEVPEPDDTGPWDLKTPLNVWCAECDEVITVKDVRAYILSLHHGVCRSLVLLNGDTD